MTDLYKQAWDLLKTEYETNRAAVADDAYYLAYVEEKWRHSRQVAGAGNLILRHENAFVQKDADFIETAKTAILLHDIYRFRECRLLKETGERIDHGVCGAAFLSEKSEFDDLLITLPIKHHGHMIEDLYDDVIYKSLPDGEFKDDLKHVAFAIRDADKIANWQILTCEYEAMKPVWLPFPQDESSAQGEIDDVLWNDFCRCTVSPYRGRKTNAEILISTLCWIFDVNYQSSIDFCSNLNLFEKFMNLLAITKVSPEKIKTARAVVRDYVLNKFNKVVL